jgi:hypothetical protein
MAMVFQALAFLITLVLPETLPVKEPDGACAISRVASSEGSEDSAAEEENEKAETWKAWMHETGKAFGFVTRDASVSILLVTFLVSKLGRQSLNLLLQYVSKRYDWKLSQVSRPTLNYAKL